MRAPSSNDDPLDRRPANQARFPGALVNAVLQLKKTANAVRVDVIRNRGAAPPDRLAQHLGQRYPQTLQFGPRQPARLPPRPNTPSKKTFIGIDIPYSRQQCLIEQRSLDGQATPAEETRKRHRPQSQAAPHPAPQNLPNPSNRGIPNGQSGADQQTGSLGRWPGSALHGCGQRLERPGK